MVAPDLAMAIIQAGEPGCLDAEHAALTAQGTRAVMKYHPKAKIQWWVAGYDDDPRSLWDIPEVAAHIRRCAAEMGWDDGYLLPHTRLEPALICMLVRCGAFGSHHPFDVRITA